MLRSHGTVTMPLRAVALMGLAMLLGGCGANYPSPPPPLRPTIVGIIRSATADDAGCHTLLTDGRVIDQPKDGKWKLLGPVYDQGDLFLSGDGFSDALLPWGDGCWQAWSGGSRYAIAWDEGDRILFEDGTELPKAPDFTTDQPSALVNGKLAWAKPSNSQMSLWMAFCANSQGQIEWGKLTH